MRENLRGRINNAASRHPTTRNKTPSPADLLGLVEFELNF
ncbi:hypothetical protein VVMO6_00273 [Vibrio vulnificus MO6-24/O]|nr:hypothetical protein VVMO6_00273 [Vibrio vulnificus MO6-24/O]